MSEPAPLPPEDAHDGRRHDRRYMLFAVILAIVVLTFAAVSITVVVSTSGG